MSRRPLRILASLMVALTLPAALLAGCKGGESPSDDKADAKAAGKTEGKGGEKAAAAGGSGEPTLQVAGEDKVADAPLPPKGSLVWFAVDGSLLPLGCFSPEAGKIETGAACLGRVAAGQPVWVAAGQNHQVVKVTGPVEPLCMAGTGKKVALGAEGLESGGDYEFGVWPAGANRAIRMVSDDTTKPAALQLDAEQQSKLQAAVAAAGGRKGEVRAHQVAEVDVNGSGAPDLFFSVFVPHPKTDERYLWTGAFLALDGDLSAPLFLGKARTSEDVLELRGVADVDGDGTAELWVRLVFAEGAGDRLYAVTGGKSRPLGAWSCGV